MSARTLPKPARLSRRAEFATVRQQGKSWHGRFMILGGWQSGDGQPARIGVITSRRLGGAVERVRVRRRLREIFRLHRAGLRPGLWLVMVPRRAAVGVPAAVLEEEWRALAGRAGYFRPKEETNDES